MYTQFKDDITNYIQNFPESEEPALFGQHLNSEIKMRIEDSKLLNGSLQVLILG